MNIAYIVNPASQNGATGRHWHELAQVLPSADRIYRTSGPNEASDLAEKAANDGAEIVASVGGDGTLCEVVTGLMRLPVQKRPALALVPRGTGGDFRKTLGLPTDIAGVATVIRRGRSRAVDVGRVTYTNAAGSEASRYFMNICSFGLSGVVDRAVNSQSKALGGKASFFIGGLQGILSFDSVACELSLDDGPFEAHDAMLVAACNGRVFGGGMYVAPTADPSDGEMEIVVWSRMSGISKYRNLLKIYSGGHLGVDGVHYKKAKKVVARSPGEALIDVDGEQLGRLPLTVELVPGALRVVY